MKYLIAILLIISPVSILHAQSDEHIINELFFDLWDPLSFDLMNNPKDTLLISSRIYKTYFAYDSTTFGNETGLKVSKKIISDWKKNMVSDDFISFWNANELNIQDILNAGNDTVIEKKPFVICLSQSEEDSLFKKTKQRQKIYSLSKLLFDNTEENAIFDFLYIPWPGDISGYKIFIKKVFGKWVIIARFHYSMT